MAKDSLEEFFGRVRESCTTHAKRKGYTNDGADAGNVAGPLLEQFGVTEEHALGEILLKLLEYRKEPRRVVLEKCVGWLWRIWIHCKE